MAVEVSLSDLSIRGEGRKGEMMSFHLHAASFLLHLLTLSFSLFLFPGRQTSPPLPPSRRILRSDNILPFHLSPSSFLHRRNSLDFDRGRWLRRPIRKHNPRERLLFARRFCFGREDEGAGGEVQEGGRWEAGSWVGCEGGRGRGTRVSSREIPSPPRSTFSLFFPSPIEAHSHTLCFFSLSFSSSSLSVLPLLLPPHLPPQPNNKVDLKSTLLLFPTLSPLNLPPDLSSHPSSAAPNLPTSPTSVPPISTP